MGDNNLMENKDGDPTRSRSADAPPIGDRVKQVLGEGPVKKKRRRGKTKRKISKPFLKLPWQDRRRNEKCKRNNRFRKVVMTKTHAPYNNNQFLMEIHKPEPENNFQISELPSARTRDSSFSVDSEENYFYSLPEDEEDFLTKEFSSVYEDAQSERLANMSKNELIQEYIILESKYESLVKRVDRSKMRYIDEDPEKEIAGADRDMSATDKDSDVTDRDTTTTSTDLSMETPFLQEFSKKMKEQEEHIRELMTVNDKLRLENEHLRRRPCRSSTADSESDSTTSSYSCSSRSQSASPVFAPPEPIDDLPVFEEVTNVNSSEQCNGEHPMVNGFDHDEPPESLNM